MKRGSTVFAAFLVLLVLCSNSLALPKTASEAEILVTGWLKANSQPLGTSLDRPVKRVETFADDVGKPIYYIVYLQSSGFVIVSADDLIEPIIGFAGSGFYDNSPDSPLGALVTNDLNGRMALVSRNAIQPLSASSPEHKTEAQNKWKYYIGLALTADDGLGLMSSPPIQSGEPSKVWVWPFVQTKWGQTWEYEIYQYTIFQYPWYNFYTPQVVDDEVVFIVDNIYNYPCGCVATAMAQVMRYHKHPNEPVEPNIFMIKVNDYEVERALIGGQEPNGVYNWDDMVPDYTWGTDIEYRRATGALCHDAGVSIGTHYTPSGSGAYLDDAAKALVDTFHYANVLFADSNDMGIDGNDLINIINPNLDGKLPVILGIRDSSKPKRGGHAVLCDGYGFHFSTMYHHLNMGWYGIYDFWYNLPNIDYPDKGHFDVITDCVYNIFPDAKGEIISGRITNTKGKPISDVVVTAQNGADGQIYTETSDLEGIYALTGLEPNSTYIFTMNKFGYDFEQYEFSTEISIDGSIICGNKWGANITGYNNSETVTIGTEELEWDYPLQTYYEDSRTQTIYLAGEIGTGGKIMDLSLNFAKSPGQTLENWTIRMKHTNLSEYNTGSFDTTGWTIVYQNNEDIRTGRQTFELQTPFEYNGTDNLLIDFSYNNSSYSENGLCFASSTGSKRSAYAKSDSDDGDPLDWSTTNAPEISLKDLIPNIKMTLLKESRVINGGI